MVGEGRLLATRVASDAALVCKCSLPPPPPPLPPCSSFPLMQIGLEEEFTVVAYLVVAARTQQPRMIRIFYSKKSYPN